VYNEFFGNTLDKQRNREYKLKIIWKKQWDRFLRSRLWGRGASRTDSRS